MTAGSRGDVAPFTGLGHGLVRAGHEVTLVTHARFAPLVAGSGVDFHALPVDPRAELESERGRGCTAAPPVRASCCGWPGWRGRWWGG